MSPSVLPSALMLRPLTFLASPLPCPHLYSSTRQLFRLLSSSSNSGGKPFRVARSSSSFTQMDSEGFKFGPYQIGSKEVFYTTQLSYCFVNLRPVVPDVLVCPQREVKRFADLTADETCDLWLTAQKIDRELESYHKASSLTFTIQDGPHAGQTVPHVHIHILPRRASDFENNDEIYDAIDKSEKELKKKLDLDKERKDRSREEMHEEAAEYRKLLS